MTRWNSLQAFAILLCVAAGYFSYNLLQKHITGSSGVTWFESMCKENAAGGSTSCGAVLASPYAYWPAKDDPDSRALHVPVAFLGLAYYSVLGVWLFGVGRPSVERRWIHIIPLALIVFGLMGSGYFLYVMFTKLEQWCPWCLITHIINLFVAASVLLLFPRDARADVKEVAEGKKKPERAVGAAAVRACPSARLACTTLLAIVLVIASEAQMLGRQNLNKTATSLQANFNRCVDAVKRIQASGRALLADWEDGASCDIEIRGNDPIRLRNTDAGPSWTVVVFSDFECPSCRRFAGFLEQNVEPLFDGRLRTVFKHYPLDPKCNGRVRLPTHPHACDAAKIAESARLLGGNEAFWRAHDYLFNHRDAIHEGTIASDDVARAINIDPAMLRQAMTSGEIQERVDGDVAQAAHCALTGTPGVFVNGKSVDTLATLQLSFWDKLADVLWEQSGTPRPANTRPPNPKATQDTPVPVIGP